MRSVSIERDFASWRDVARKLLREKVEPREVLWNDSAAGELLPMLGKDPPPNLSPNTERGAGMSNLSPLSVLGERLGEGSSASPQIKVPQQLLAQFNFVACHRDIARWGLMYRILWRVTHGEPHLLEVTVDDDVHELMMMDKAVHRDRHKMTAFVRFRRVEIDGDERFIAWHRPDHYIVKLTAPFFRDRFANMHWTILTPDDSVTWDRRELCFGPGVPVSAAPSGDALEELWATYYGSIFNPARIKLKAMQKEMPKKHWATMPETQLIPGLLKDAPKRVEEMVKRAAKKPLVKPKAPGKLIALHDCDNTGSAADFLPATKSLPQLREAARSCRGCDIYCNATQVVFGDGPADALVMFVGEQPGDQEDRAGKPFIGPAGQMLDEVLHDVGIDRANDVYVTNAVKHFKWEPRGKMRLHSKPSARESAACRPWLEAEIAAINPQMIVCLGATAAQSLLGAGFRITKSRGEVMTDQPWAPWVMATYHPSALLRMPDEAARRQAQQDFTDDLRVAARQIAEFKANRAAAGKT